MQLFRLLAPLTLLALASCASVRGESFVRPGFDFVSVGNIAIVSGETTTFSTQTRQALLETFQFEFLRNGWPVVERADIQTAVDELEFQNSDFASPIGRGQVGHIKNVDALVIVNSWVDGGDLSIAAKMVNPQNGEVLWAGQGDGSINSGLSTLAGAVVGAAAGAAINEGTGTTVGGVIGGVVGHSLAPNDLENAKDLVREIMANLPSRMPQSALP